MTECCCAPFLWKPVPDWKPTRQVSCLEEDETLSPSLRSGPVSPKVSLQLLRDGNARFATGRSRNTATNEATRKQLEITGEAPHCAIIGCADARAPLETIFDAMPGDIFALRNIGNTCTHAEGSMVGSLEFCIGKLRSRLILVLGHSHCSAVYGATQSYFDTLEARSNSQEVITASSALDGLLLDLSCVAEQAAGELGVDRSIEDVAHHAVKLNVFHTVNFLLKFSGPIREKVRSRQLEIQGAIYDLPSGRVDFLGCSPDQDEYLSSKIPLPLSVARDDSLPARGSGVRGVRTAYDGRMSAKEALEMLKEGNNRFVLGTPLAMAADDSMREALVYQGQAPHTAVLGCADSRAPVDTLFDSMPGDLFVLRNAGNTCTHAEGSMLGSLEFCACKLSTKLILVLGHTQCSALTGAAEAYLKSQDGGEDGLSSASSVSTALEGLLTSLSSVSKRTADTMSVEAELKQLVAHSVRVNVFHSIDFMLKYSMPIRELVKNGGLEIHGGIYRLETGRVDFLGPSPNQAKLLSSELHLPPSMAVLPIRTSFDEPLHPNMSLKLLKEGNERYVYGHATAKVSNCVRRALAEDGQAPHCAIIGCADSRAPLEAIFDAMPGDIFALRNAGNTCTHSEGSMLGSLEFCTSSLGTQLILVLGHTQCTAVRGATKMFLESGGPELTENKAWDALLAGLSIVAKQAATELGAYANEEAIIARATKLNIYRSINFLLQYSGIIREKVEMGELEIQGGIYDLETGQVHFLGRSPLQNEILRSDLALEKLAGC
ncbi:unnamed protein product [Durusdinium trenchii]|uniref:carbonic anhydrase n=1 Tax=Durusdinium trenchii TaxID=1381693 RepID=A0ABP0KLB3_9DINO